MVHRSGEHTQGLFLGSYGPDDANPDIGDSAITETAGIGGFAMAAAPAIVKFVGGDVPFALRATQTMYEITVGEHTAYQVPILEFRGTPTGIDVAAVARTGILPQINTGMAGRVAGTGQVGAGLVTPPEQCFTQALTALAAATREVLLPPPRTCPAPGHDLFVRFVMNSDHRGYSRRELEETTREHHMTRFETAAALVACALVLVGLTQPSASVTHTSPQSARHEFHDAAYGSFATAAASVAVPRPLGSGRDYSLLYPAQLGAPYARWNPCKPVYWRVNPRSVSSKGAVADLRGAFARVHAATGLPFV